MSERTARATGMTQSTIARFEAGGTVATRPALYRPAEARDADLAITVNARYQVA